MSRMAVGLTGRYANALYGAATKASALDAVRMDVAKLRSLAAASTPFTDFLRDPSLSRSAKKDVLSSVMKAGDFHPTLATFLYVVAENGRATDAEKILDDFHAMVAVGGGAHEAIVTSAAALSEWELALLKKSIVKRFFGTGSGVEVEVAAVVDPELVGGFTVQVGDKFVDLSVKAELMKVTSFLQKTLEG